MNPIDKVILENYEKSPKEFIDALQALEEDALKNEADNFKKLEIARAFAERKISFLSTQRTPRALHDVLWSKLIDIGFTSDIRRLDMLFHRIRYLRFFDMEMDVNEIENLKMEMKKYIDDLQEKGNTESSEHFRKVLARFED